MGKQLLNEGVHRTHCCVIHGCKYGNPDCPVESGDVEQEYLCESCDHEHIKDMDELRILLRSKMRKCSHCGQYYDPKVLEDAWNLKHGKGISK